MFSTLLQKILIRNGKLKSLDTFENFIKGYSGSRGLNESEKWKPQNGVVISPMDQPFLKTTIKKSTRKSKQAFNY